MAERVIWLRDWFSPPFPSAAGLILALRSAIDESRDQGDAPGWGFAPFSLRNQENFEGSPEANTEAGVFMGLLILLMTHHGWQGDFAVAGCSDVVEFWEGHIFVYSADPARLAEAKALLIGWKCELWAR